MTVIGWLHSVAVVSLLLGALCSVVLLLDLRRRPQAMAVMNVVWPVTALFGTVLTLALYFQYGRRTASHSSPSEGPEQPFWSMVAKGACHCGAGCTLGDIVAEWLCFLFPSIAIAFGWQSWFSQKMFAVWIVDFIVAYAFGVAFQYFAIRPMRHDLSRSQAVWLAIKADTLSLAAWQVGMYGFMAAATFGLFERVLGIPLRADTVEFWLMMQIAMLCGFVTAFPVNWWLIRRGIKEAM